MTFSNGMRSACKVDSVIELRPLPFILNCVLILRGQSPESTLVNAFPVSSAASSTHCSEAIKVFLAWLCCLVLCSCVWFSVWHSSDTDRQRRVEAFTKSCLSQKTRFEQLITSGGSKPLINRLITQ